MSNIFIAYPISKIKIKSGVGAVKKMLELLNHRVFTNDDFFLNKSMEVSTNTTNLFELIIVVLTKENYYALFELGYSVGCGKKVLIVTDGEVVLPKSIENLPKIIGELSDERTRKRVIKAVQEITERKKEAINSLILFLALIEKLSEIDNSISSPTCFNKTSQIYELQRNRNTLRFDNEAHNKFFNSNLFNRIEINTESINPLYYESCIYHILKKKFKISTNNKNNYKYDFVISNFKDFNNTIIQLRTLNKSSFVSIDNISEFYNTCKEEKADCGILITNSNFSNSANAYVSRKKRPNIILWTFEQLLSNLGVEETISNAFTELLKQIKNVGDISTLYSLLHEENMENNRQDED